MSYLPHILAASSGPASESDVELSVSAQYIQITLIVIGSALLLIWIIRRWKWPKKLSLASTPARPNTLTPLHVIPLFLFWQLAGSLVKQALAAAPLESAQSDLLAGILSQVITLVPLLLVGHFCFRGGLLRGVGLSMRHWGFDSIRGVYGAMAVFPVCIGLLAGFTLLVGFFWPDAVQPHVLLKTLQHSGPGWRVLVAVSAVVLAPLVEELLFRGLLQSMLRRYLRNPWHAIFITAAIFGLLHASMPQGVPSLMVLGVALGYNYERCGRLWPAILIHMIFNGIVVFLHLIP